MSMKMRNNRCCVRLSGSGVILRSSLSFSYNALLRVYCSRVCQRVNKCDARKLKFNRSGSLTSHFKHHSSELLGCFALFQSCTYTKGMQCEREFILELWQCKWYSQTSIALFQLTIDTKWNFVTKWKYCCSINEYPLKLTFPNKLLNFVSGISASIGKAFVVVNSVITSSVFQHERIE